MNTTTQNRTTTGTARTSATTMPSTTRGTTCGTPTTTDAGRTARYARCVAMSKKAEWQIDRDVFRSRGFDFTRHFLPDGLSFVDRLAFLTPAEARLMSQVQGRSYAYIFGLVERFISTKMLECGAAHALGDQIALEGLVRFSNEEIKHQEMFRRIEMSLDERMHPGYAQVADPNQVARSVLASSNWAVLALTAHIELFVQQHYEQSIAPRQDLCPLWKDIFLFHWKDECQHVMLDELEWTAEHARLDHAAHERAVEDLIALVGAVDGILQAQAASDAAYFRRGTDRRFTADESGCIDATVLAAYRWQYIVSGVRHPHFGRLLTRMTTTEQMRRIQSALAPIVDSVEAIAPTTH